MKTTGPSKLLLCCAVLLCASLISFYFGWRFNEIKNQQPNIALITDAAYTKWEGSIGTYQEKIIRDKDTAVNVALQIYTGMEKSREYADLIPRAVAYNEAEGVWIVTFGKDPSLRILGGGCSIALREEDGKVLRIWYGE